MRSIGYGEAPGGGPHMVYPQLTPTRQHCFASEAVLSPSPFQGEVKLRHGRAKHAYPRAHG